MILARGFKRNIKSQYVKIPFLIVLIWSVFISILVSRNVRLGISIFGDLTVFTSGHNILYHGANYTKGLGSVIAIIISLSIGKEYQYKTWQHLTSNNIKRNKIYITKIITSIVLAISLFLVYEIISFCILRGSNLRDVSIIEYVKLIANGIILYATLASIISFISMVIKNYVLSLLASVMFIFLEEFVVKILRQIFLWVDSPGLAINITKLSLYGMNEIIQLQKGIIFGNLLGMFLWIGLTILLGLFMFNQIEL